MIRVDVLKESRSPILESDHLLVQFVEERRLAIESRWFCDSQAPMSGTVEFRGAAGGVLDFRVRVPAACQWLPERGNLFRGTAAPAPTCDTALAPDGIARARQVFDALTETAECMNIAVGEARERYAVCRTSVSLSRRSGGWLGGRAVFAARLFADRLEVDFGGGLVLRLRSFLFHFHSHFLFYFLFSNKYFFHHFAGSTTGMIVSPTLTLCNARPLCASSVRRKIARQQRRKFEIVIIFSTLEHRTCVH